MPEPDARPQSLTVLAVYSWREFWSMGEGRGAPSFFLSITSFPRRGHEMHVLMPGRPGTPRTEDYHGVTLHRVRSRVDFMPQAGGSKIMHHARLLFSYIYWFVRVVPAGLSLANRLRPDALFGMGELGAPIACIVARLRRIPCVTRFFGIGLFFDDVRASRLKRILRYREITAFKTASDYMIVHNDGSAGDKLAQLVGVDMGRFLFYFDGVEKSRFLPGEQDAQGAGATLELGVPDGHRIVLSVARLYEEKHVDRLLRAAPGVLRERGDVTFLIVGDGEERGRLEALAAELGIQDNVVFAGAVMREHLPAVYASSDMFVTLSDRTNAFNTLYEAMLSALPVIALDVGSTSDFVDDGRTGVLLSVEELHRLPEIMLGLLDDPERTRSMGQAARTRMDETFPTIEERQAMEVEVVERAVRERAAGTSTGGGR